MRIHLVIVAGMQNCYFHEHGTMYNPDGGFTTQLLSDIQTYLSTLRGTHKVCLPFLVRRPDDTYFQHDMSYCMVGSIDTAIVPQFSSIRSYDHVQVHRTNLTTAPAFKTYLRRHDVESVTLLGVETQATILLTATTLRDLGYSVSVKSDLVASRDSYLNDSALSLMAVSSGVDVL